MQAETMEISLGFVESEKDQGLLVIYIIHAMYNRIL